MKLHRFYTAMGIEEGGTYILSDSALAHQIANVLKLRQGEKAVFFDGSGREFESEIVSIGRGTCEFKVLEAREVKSHAGLKLSLAFSLIKKDNVEWILQKCTELGAIEFMPLISKRSEKKGFNMERAKKIIIEACEQSGRADIPRVCEPTSLASFLTDEKRKIVAFHTDGKKLDREELKDFKELVLCIGPEGGWSESETSMFKEKGASLAFLDAPVLRAETAAVAAAALFLIL